MATYQQQRGIPCRRAADLTRANANQRFAVRLDPSVNVGEDELPVATLTRAEPPVVIVDDGDLTAAIVVANDLSAVTNVRVVRIQMTGATLAGATATIEVEGTDGAGAAQDQTFTLNAQSDLTAPLNTTDAYATITAITATGFSAGTADFTALPEVVDEVLGEYQTFDKVAVHIRNQGTMILRASEPYTSAFNGFGVIAGYTAGTVIVSESIGTGYGKIIGGGTESINGTDTDVYKVLIPEC